MRSGSASSTGPAASGGAVTPRGPRPRRARIPNSTPGRLLALILLAVIVMIPVFVLTVLASGGSRNAAEDLRERRIPALLAIDEVGEALAEADRAAATSLVSGAYGLTGPGQEYRAAVGRVTGAMEQAMELHRDQPSSRARLSDVHTLFIEYIGMVGSAQGDGGPLTTAKLVYASDVLETARNELDGLRAGDMARIEDARSSWWVGRPALVPFAVAAVLALLVLSLAHLLLRRRFRRRVNPWLVLAGLALAGLCGWMLTHTLTTHEDLAEGAHRGVRAQSALWQARAEVHRIVGEEALAVAAAPGSGERRRDVDTALTGLAAPAPGPSAIDAVRRGGTAPFTGLIADALSHRPPEPVRRAGADALTALEALTAADRQVRERFPAGGAGGDGADVSILTGNAPRQLSGAADDTADALAEALVEVRRSTDSALADAADDDGLRTGGPVLCAAVLLFTVTGLGVRYAEYGRNR